MALFACVMLCVNIIRAQSDSLRDICRRYMPACYADELYHLLKQKGYTKNRILSFGSFLMYCGKDECGEQLMRLALQNNDSVKASDWHAYSVQNTKNGIYAQGYAGITKAVNMNAKENEGYAGWVFLYYYRDYRLALKHLIAYDNFTPGVPDFPAGENLDFLKGLCYYQLGKLDSAYTCFHNDIDWILKARGKEAVNSFSYFYAARCLDKLNKPKQALDEYAAAIELSPYNATEALYYAGLLHARLKNPAKAKENMNKAYDLIRKGYKQQDIYAELFDEVYPIQIKESLDQLTEK